MRLHGNRKRLNIKHQKKFAFLSGLPRSGGTLLSSILDQNPMIHCAANTRLPDMMSSLDQMASSTIDCYSYRDSKIKVLNPMVYSVLEAFYSDRSENFIIDKSREWPLPQNFELLKRILPYEPKIIITVRDIIQILASFINLIHKNSNNTSFVDLEINSNQNFNFYRDLDEIRCDVLMKPNGLIDRALYGVTIAKRSNQLNNFYFVEYEDLVKNTSGTIDGIYDFLKIKSFKHNYENIFNKFSEKDEMYGLLGMHEVREKISLSNIDPFKILSSYTIQKYSRMEFWRN